MPQSNNLNIERLFARLETLERNDESRDLEIIELKSTIVTLEKRLTTYDLLAAKWGGVLMVSVAIGAFVIVSWDRVKSLAVWIGKQ